MRWSATEASRSLAPVRSTSRRYLGRTRRRALTIVGSQPAQQSPPPTLADHQEGEDDVKRNDAEFEAPPRPDDRRRRLRRWAGRWGAFRRDAGLGGGEIGGRRRRDGALQQPGRQHDGQDRATAEPKPDLPEVALALAGDRALLGGLRRHRLGEQALRTMPAVEPLQD